MKAKRDEAKAQVWAARIAAFNRSGLTRREWCRQAGVNPNTLDYWRSRLRSPALVPIVVRAPDAREAPTSALSLLPSIELAAGRGVRLTVHGAQVAWLAALLRALAC